MFPFFKRRRKSAAQAVPSLMDSFQRQRRKWVVSLVALLSRGEQRLTVFQKKIIIGLFCLGMSFLSCYWLYVGLWARGNTNGRYLQPDHVVRPLDIGLPDSLDVNYLQERKRRATKTATDTTH